MESDALAIDLGPFCKAMARRSREKRLLRQLVPWPDLDKKRKEKPSRWVKVIGQKEPLHLRFVLL